MIAYVDENGMITDTPPTPNNKPQEVDMSTIEVSTPRRTGEPIELVHEGRIEHFNVSKGYGFVKDLKNAEKYRSRTIPCTYNRNRLISFFF